VELPETKNRTFKEVMAFYNIYGDTVAETAVDPEAPKIPLGRVALREAPGVVAERLKESFLSDKECAKKFEQVVVMNSIERLDGNEEGPNYVSLLMFVHCTIN